MWLILLILATGFIGGIILFCQILFFGYDKLNKLMDGKDEDISK